MCRIHDRIGAGIGVGGASVAWEKRRTLKVGDALAVIKAKLIALKIVLVLCCVKNGQLQTFYTPELICALSLHVYTCTLCTLLG